MFKTNNVWVIAAKVQLTIHTAAWLNVSRRSDLQTSLWLFYRCEWLYLTFYDFYTKTPNLALRIRFIFFVIIKANSGFDFPCSAVINTDLIMTSWPIQYTPSHSTPKTSNYLPLMTGSFNTNLPVCVEYQVVTDELADRLRSLPGGEARWPGDETTVYFMDDC